MADAPRRIEEREFVLLLISLYRDHPELWKIKSKDYSNKNKRIHAMRNILNVLKIYKPDFDEDKLKKKINVLRTNFNKEYQKIEQKTRTSEDIREPKLWYYDEFLFVKEQLDVEETEPSDPLIKEESPQPSASQAATPVKKKKKTPDSTEKLTQLAIEYFKRSNNESDILAKGWVMKLNRLAPDQRLYAEKIINDTLFEAEMGTLTRNGVRFLSSSPAPSISPPP